MYNLGQMLGNGLAEIRRRGATHGIDDRPQVLDGRFQGRSRAIAQFGRLDGRHLLIDLAQFLLQRRQVDGIIHRTLLAVTWHIVRPFHVIKVGPFSHLGRDVKSVGRD